MGKFIITGIILALSAGSAAFAKSQLSNLNQGLSKTQSLQQRESAQTAKPLIVAVDPGHGGSNVGAVGISHKFNEAVVEKTVTLQIAKRLSAALTARGVKVVLVRQSDQFMTLRQRSTIANRAHADIFVSLHLNASHDHSWSGFETYFLSAEAVDIDSRALRTIGEPREGLSAAISRLLDDVERGLAQPRSADLAQFIQKELATVRPHFRNRGVKQESMHVLLGATMPAVLVEVGFIDHPLEGRQLIEPSVQAQLATAISDAIVDYTNYTNYTNGAGVNDH